MFIVTYWSLFLGPPISANIQPSAVVAWWGDEVAFTCTASGGRLKGFTWYKDGELTNTGVTRVSDNSSVVRLQFSHSVVGVYWCRVDGPGVGYWIAEATCWPAYCETCELNLTM